MVIEAINDLLIVKIPNQSAHIVGATSENIGMIGTEPDAFNRKGVLGQHHDWLLCRASEIPNFDSVISAGCGYEILVFVEVHREYFVSVGMDSFNVPS